MADDFSVGSSPKNATSLFKRKVFGIPIVLIVAVFVVALALYAWKAKDSTGDVEESIDPDADEETGSNTANLYPISPTGTVYAQSPQAVEDNAPYFGNSEWLRKCVTEMSKKGMNPGEVQLALQAYLNGDHLTYQQSLIRDQAIKDYGMPPENFTAGTNDPKPAPNPPPTVTNPTPAPVTNPAPAPKPTTARRTHKVVKGDTLWDLAIKYYGHGLQWRKIAAANGNPNPRKLRVGTILVIP